jgi:hypothetical protein
MKRPNDAPLFLAELSTALSELEHRSDILALAYVSDIYHIAATYGLTELGDPIEDAFEKIYERYQKDDPVKLHYLVSMLSRFPRYALNKEQELEQHLDKLDMPEVTRLSMSVLKMNTEAYRNRIGNEN